MPSRKESCSPALSNIFVCYTVITCDLLEDLGNGSIVYHDNVTEQLVFGTVANHSCDEGYFLVGDSVRTCEGSGSTVEGEWSGTAPVCSGRPCIWLGN